MTPYFAGRLVEALIANGDIDQAMRRLDELLAETPGSGEPFWGVELLRLRPAVAAAQSAPETIAATSMRPAGWLRSRGQTGCCPASRGGRG